MRYYRTFFNHYNTILYGMGTIIAIFKLGAAIYFYIITNVSVLVDYGIFNIAPVANAHYRRIAYTCGFYVLQGLIIIAAHYVAILNGSANTYARTYTNYRPCNMTGADDSAVGYNSLVYVRTAHF